MFVEFLSSRLVWYNLESRTMRTHTSCTDIWKPKTHTRRKLWQSWCRDRNRVEQSETNWFSSMRVCLAVCVWIYTNMIFASHTQEHTLLRMWVAVWSTRSVYFSVPITHWLRSTYFGKWKTWDRILQTKRSSQCDQRDFTFSFYFVVTRWDSIDVVFSPRCEHVTDNSHCELCALLLIADIDRDDCVKENSLSTLVLISQVKNAKIASRKKEWRMTNKKLKKKIRKKRHEAST